MYTPIKNGFTMNILLDKKKPIWVVNSPLIEDIIIMSNLPFYFSLKWVKTNQVRYCVLQHTEYIFKNNENFLKNK